jgi:hypothetical protein
VLADVAEDDFVGFFLGLAPFELIGHRNLRAARRRSGRTSIRRRYSCSEFRTT